MIEENTDGLDNADRAATVMLSLSTLQDECGYSPQKISSKIYGGETRNA